MRVPTFPGADEQDAVSRILDHISVIVKLESEFLILRHGSVEHHAQIVVSAGAALLQGHALVLKERQRFAVLPRYAVDGQGAGEFKRQNARSARFRLNANGSDGVEGIVVENRRL